MSGLVNGLQNRLQQFESARHLREKQEDASDKLMHPPFLFIMPCAPMVNGQWSMINGQRSMVNDQWITPSKSQANRCLPF